MSIHSEYKLVWVLRYLISFLSNPVVFPKPPPQKSVNCVKPPDPEQLGSLCFIALTVINTSGLLPALSLLLALLLSFHYHCLLFTNWLLSGP